MANISKFNVGGSSYDLRDAASLHYIGKINEVPLESTTSITTDIVTNHTIAKYDYIVVGTDRLNYVCTAITTTSEPATTTVTWTLISEAAAEIPVQDVTVAGTSVLNTTNHTAEIVKATTSTATEAKFGVVQTGDNITNTAGVISVENATDAVKGVVQLSTAIPSDPTTAVDTKAATEKAVADAIGNATITVSGTGVTSQTFTTNQSADQTITVNVPIKEIKVNDTALTPDASQSVNIEIPTDSMTFKGTVGSTASPTSATRADVPVDGTAKVGDTYKVVTDGKYANDTINAEVGDLLVCLTKTASPAANTWVLIPSGDDVDVTSVAASTGLTTASGSAITQTGTIKMDLTSETALADTAAAPTTTASSGRVFAVALDHDGHPAVNVTPGTLATVVNDVYATSAVTGLSTAKTQSTGGVIAGHVGTAAAEEDTETLYLDYINPATDAAVVTKTAPAPTP